LLDTQIIVLAARTPEKLSERVRRALLDPANERYVSLVSLWEIAIKRSTGRLSVTDADIDQTLIDLAAEDMPIRRQHVLGVADLPFHHRDPFDRLLIAQAKIENLTLATSDRHFPAYGIGVLRA
jgi:PIN domain nuclease of toxin-antitoxin system